MKQGIELNKYFASLVRSSQDLSLVTEPSFALSVFRLTPPSVTSGYHDKSQLEGVLNDLNKIYYDQISARPDILLTQTKLNGVFCIRFAIGAARTKEEHIDHAWSILQEEAQSAIAHFQSS